MFLLMDFDPASGGLHAMTVLPDGRRRIQAHSAIAA